MSPKCVASHAGFSSLKSSYFFIVKPEPANRHWKVTGALENVLFWPPAEKILAV